MPHCFFILFLFVPLLFPVCDIFGVQPACFSSDWTANDKVEERQRGGNIEPGWRGESARSRSVTSMR